MDQKISINLHLVLTDRIKKYLWLIFIYFKKNYFQDHLFNCCLDGFGGYNRGLVVIKYIIIFVKNLQYEDLDVISC